MKIFIFAVVIKLNTVLFVIRLVLNISNLQTTEEGKRLYTVFPQSFY